MELFFNADAIEILSDLTPATRHKVMDAAVRYSKTGEMPTNLSTNVMALFKALIALSKASQVQSEPTVDVQGTRRTRSHNHDAYTIEKALKAISDTFTLPQYLTDEDRRQEQLLMLKVRDTVMNRYNILRPQN